MCAKNLSTNYNFRERSNLNIHLVHLKISSFEFYSILNYQFILTMWITYF